MEGSRRISLRNRIHLRPILHQKAHMPTRNAVLTDNESNPSSSSSSSSLYIQLDIPARQSVIRSDAHNSGAADASTEDPGATASRRSTRDKNPPARYGDWVYN